MRSDSSVFVRNRRDARETGRLRKNTACRGFSRAVVSALFVLVLLSGGSCSRQSIETQDSLDAFTEYFDGRVPRLMDQYGIPGVSMALVRDGELV